MAEKVSADEAEATLTPPPPEESPTAPEDGLEILGPEKETFETSQGPITIGPMVMGQIAKFMKAAKPLLPLLKSQAEAGTGEFNVTALVTEDSDSFFNAVAAAAGTTPQVIENLGPDEFIKVVTKVFVVNVDFFVRTLPAALGGAEVSVMTAVTKLQARVTQRRSKG